jgi:cell wall-associated NlpC family hydrolase
MTTESQQMTEEQQRAAVVTEALSWLRTPYHSMGRVKAAGVDCYTLLLETFQTVGLFTSNHEVQFYPSDWFLHAHEDHYKLRIMRHATEMIERFCSQTAMHAPGNIVLVRIQGKRGSLDAHGGIITSWPKVIHAYPPCVMEADARYHPAFTGGRLEFYSPWGNRNV